MEHIRQDVLEDLLGDLSGNTRCYERFLGDFVSLWPVRLERVEEGLRHGDTETAEVALLGIRSSGLMVGALPLAGLADSLLRALLDDLPYARRQLLALRDAGDAACAALADYLQPGAKTA